MHEHALRATRAAVNVDTSSAKDRARRDRRAAREDFMQFRISEMPLLAAALALLAVTSVLPAVAQPITLSIIDVGGDLSSTQAIVEAYRKANPTKIKDIRIQRAPQPELPAKIKAQQDAGRLDINLIMTGQAAASALIANGQLVRLLPDHEKLFPLDDFTEAAKSHLKEGDGFVIPSVVSNGGPVFIFNPKKVPSPPKTPQDLLAWAKANPGRFFYARPANSGPGTSIVVGLPYLLGDKDPRDPENGWDKTWAFLKELGQYIEYYPTGTLFTLREFAQEQRWMIAGIMEWDMKPRAEGVVPPESKITILDNTTFLIDGHYWAIPKGVPQNEIDIILDLMKFMLQPEQQAYTWRGFIGPVNKKATLAAAPPDIRDYVKEFWRPEYDDMDKKYKIVPMLEVRKLTYMFDRWDKEVGAQKIKR
jgi:putative spermidine/putrescine transport system substrate-binding protein